MEQVDLTPLALGDSQKIGWRKKCQIEAVAVAKALTKAHAQREIDSAETKLQSVRRSLVADFSRRKSSLGKALVAICHLYADLLEQGWEIRTSKGQILGRPPEMVSGSEGRSHKQKKLTVRRNEQLREHSIRDFIDRMERGQLIGTSRHSIYSLMRDGRELARSLETARSVDALAELVKPYVVFVRPGAKCPHTGLMLQDIWRYFRHGWSNPYESIPGRTLMGLVRDAAAKNHPVIGIFAVSSAAIGLDVRDRFIGWDSEMVLDEWQRGPLPKYADWFSRIIDKLLSGIYLGDLIRDKVIPARLPKIIAPEVLQKLNGVESEARETHHRLSNAAENKTGNVTNDASDSYWEAQACTPLYRAKRARELANILEIRNLVNSLATNPDESNLTRLLNKPEGRAAVRKLIKAAKSISVGTEIADLTVCGAIAPYNALLGGKLVAAMAIGPKVVGEYKTRYTAAVSVIASSMAGRQIVRPNNLVFIGTTSLYGIRPNQYDRIAIPASIFGKPSTGSLKYKFLGYTEEGVGTFQFGKLTKSAIENAGRALSNGWKANNVFGEGTSPKLRSLRDGLRLLGLRADSVLRHQMHKAVYGASLIENLRDYLLGIDPDPIYVYPVESGEQAEKLISDWWRHRWCFLRIDRAEVIEQIRANTLIHPIKHGARIQRSVPESDQYAMSLQ